MAILSDGRIISEKLEGSIIINPWNPERLNPNSYDLTISNKIGTYKEYTLVPPGVFVSKNFFDLKEEQELFVEEFDEEEGYILRPNNLYLLATNEIIGSDYFVPTIEGKSSLARLGITIHLTAGFIDIGFFGSVTLEVTVVHPVKIYPNIPFCQVFFNTIEGNVCESYSHKVGSKYLDQKPGIPVASRYFKNFKK